MVGPNRSCDAYMCR